MIKNPFTLICSVAVGALWFVTTSGSLWAQTWQPIASSPGLSEIDRMAPVMRNNETFLIGGRGRFCISPDRGKTWHQLCALGRNATINQINFNESEIFAATSAGLWSSANQGKTWQKIFVGLGDAQQNVSAVAFGQIENSVLYLGTDGGLFKSDNGGSAWLKETNELGRQSIRDLVWAQDGKELFAISEKGLYRFLPKHSRLDRIYESRTRVEIDEAGDLESEESPEGSETSLVTTGDEISALLILPGPGNELVIATRDGIFTSDDEGNHWSALSSVGLGNAKVRDLAYSPATDTLFAAADKGIFALRIDDSRWKELYEGLMRTEIKQLELVPENPEILYALAADGIYQMIVDPVAEIRAPSFHIPGDRMTTLSKLFDKEPTIQNIQKQAIRYANTSNWKTRRWQWSSRLRALIPSFSIGKSFSTSNNVDLDRGSTNDPDEFIMGPADTDRNWDFDLKWELGDLIWNSAQTSIDSREKMMVELRNDILSEVSRLYFERRRAQVEFVLKPPEDVIEQTQALLRIDELTANIDSLTGSYLTKMLDQIYGENPELKELWHLNL